MKSKPLPTAFPAFGEVVHQVFDMVKFTSWEDFETGRDPKKTESKGKKQPSDELRDWATEQAGKPLNQKRLAEFLRKHTTGLSLGPALVEYLGQCVEGLRALHHSIVNEEATHLGRKETRAWYGRRIAPGVLFLLYEFQKQLLRIAPTGGPLLNDPICLILCKAWSGEGKKSPLVQIWASHYLYEHPSGAQTLDHKVLESWRSGKVLPSPWIVGQFSRNYPRPDEIWTNLVFALLVERLVKLYGSCFAVGEQTEARYLLALQAGKFSRIDAVLASEASLSGAMVPSDYGHYLFHRIREFGQVAGEEMGGNAQFRFFRLYVEKFIGNRMPPPAFGAFFAEFNQLWIETQLSEPSVEVSALRARIERLKNDESSWRASLSGPLLAMEVRLHLRDSELNHERLKQILSLYQNAVEQSRHQTGIYLRPVIQEALGLAAILYVAGVKGRSSTEWMKRTLDQWDLAKLGADFDHEVDELRFERAAFAFGDLLHPELLGRVRAALPSVGLHHRHMGFFWAMGDVDYIRQLMDVPVPLRSPGGTLTETVTGRKQSLLMEAIDRCQIARAEELVEIGADLNFINSTGDTCVTKAFARGYHGLIVKILKRQKDPICRETLLRVTDKRKLSVARLVIKVGHEAVLQAFTQWKDEEGYLFDVLPAL